MYKRELEAQSRHARPCLISSCDQENKKSASLLHFLTSHQFSVGDGQDGEGVVEPRGAAQILAVTVGLKRWRLSLEFADLALPFGGGPDAEFADGVREPLLQGAHRASGARGAGG